MADLTFIPSTQSSPVSTATLVKPDEQTAKRIKNLALVGAALAAGVTESTYDSNIFNAKGALEVFKAGIDKLDIDTQSRQGIADLVNLLNRELEKVNQQVKQEGI